MTDRDEVIQVLEDAASHLDTYGWQQHAWGSRYQKTCAEGAIRAVTLDVGVHPVISLSARAALADTVNRRGGCETSDTSVTHWNDMHCHSASEAADMLRFAAKDLAGDDPDSD